MVWIAMPSGGCGSGCGGVAADDRA